MLIFLAVAGGILLGWAIRALEEVLERRSRRRYLDGMDGPLMTRDELIAANRHSSSPWNQ